MISSPLTDDLVSKQMSPLNNLFTKVGARPPLVIWDPTCSSLPQPMMKRFFQLAQSRANPDGTLNANALELDSFGELRDWMMLIHFDSLGGETHLAHFGAAIAAYRDSCLDHCSTPASERRDPGCHVGTFLRATYRAMCAVRKPLLTGHQACDRSFVCEWQRLAFPLTDGASDRHAPKPVIGCVTLAYAENEISPGLETLIDPFLVLDAGHRVMYANHPARVLFNDGQFGPWGRDILEFAGFEVTLPMEPQDLHVSRRVMHFTARYLRKGVGLNLEIRARSLRQNQNYYYLLDIRQPQ